MNTNKSLALVAKCNAILKLIDKANRKLENLNRRLESCNKNVMPCFSTRPLMEIHIKNSEAVLERLTRYYSRTLTLLTEEALHECFEQAA